MTGFVTNEYRKDKKLQQTMQLLNKIENNW